MNVQKGTKGFIAGRPSWNAGRHIDTHKINGYQYFANSYWVCFIIGISFAIGMNLSVLILLIFLQMGIYLIPEPLE